MLVLTFALPAAVACGASDPTEPGGQAGSGSAGLAQAGSVAQAGAAPAQAGSGVGGTGVSGASSVGGAATGAAGAGASGMSTGGAAGAGGSPAVGGMAGTGGSTAGQGGSGGAGGSNSSDVAKALDGIRVDDPCAGTADTSTGAVCQHVVLTSAGGFKSAKEATITGTPGTTYDVTLRIRGIVECTQIDGGMRPDTSTFQYQNMTWRKVPFTIGGTASHADYSQWRITVDSPKQEYFLNDYQKVGHYIFKLDYQVTIQMAANSKVTLDGNDSNERQIVNYEKYTLDGIPGSMNYGQFIQVNVVSVKPH
ncbi:MAG TPA: hypothetical protein VER12_04680 [Polyangiaceae bacterium]|nr:hypothetical protein [Polyangiaceae bacterium]